MHDFDNLSIRFTSKLWVSAHFQAALSRRRCLPEWVQKWVRLNESLLNIKDKMASISLFLPWKGTAYSAPCPQSDDECVLHRSSSTYSRIRLIAGMGARTHSFGKRLFLSQVGFDLLGISRDSTRGRRELGPD